VIRVLVADDSPLVRRLLGDALDAAGGFELAFARDGAEALEVLGRFAADVVTLDVHMPGLDGLACLDRIMLERPRPVVMISSLTGEGAQATLRAFELGAIDVLEKPAGPLSLQMADFSPRLVETLRAAAGARLNPAHRLAERVRRRAAVGAAPSHPPVPLSSAPLAPRPAPRVDWKGSGRVGLILVGCSTGGPSALEVLLSGLPGGLAWPVVVAQHMPAGFTAALARRLDGLCALAVREVCAPVPLQPGSAYIGRGDADVVVSRRGDQLVALPAPPLADARWRPSVDRLIRSACDLIPATRLAAVVMTGMGDDGAAAAAGLRAAGGLTLAESADTAVVWGMPGALVRLGGATATAPLDQLAGMLAAALA
jgi:two-component system, chemotaxis family, protein-glutamate methylesterase/glutaminase